MARKRRQEGSSDSSEKAISGYTAGSNAIEEGAAKINKQRKANIVVRASSDMPVNVIPTGIFALDYALLGGWDEGRASTVFGYHSSGKSTHITRGIKEFQIKKQHLAQGQEIVGGNTFFCDAEDQFDETWAETLGVDTEAVWINNESQHGNELLDVCIDMLYNPDIGMIVLDSIAALIPKMVEERSIEDETIGALAKMCSKFSSHVTKALRIARANGNPKCLLMINQPRDNMAAFGSPIKLPGGRQIQHIARAMVWLKLRKDEIGTDAHGIGDTKLYSQQAFQIEKAKSGSSIKTAEFGMNHCPAHDYLDVGGIDNAPTVFSLAKKMGYVQGGGGKYRLITTPNEDTFSKHDDILQLLINDVDEYETLARSIIASKRREIGKSALPPDGYLVGANGRPPVLIDLG